VKEVVECDNETLIGSPHKMDERRSSPGCQQTSRKEQTKTASLVELKHLQSSEDQDLTAGSTKLQLPPRDERERNSSLGSVATDNSVTSLDRANYSDTEGTEAKDIELEIFEAVDSVE
jgi:hypothetical protein